MGAVALRHGWSVVPAVVGREVGPVVRVALWVGFPLALGWISHGPIGPGPRLLRS